MIALVTYKMNDNGSVDLNHFPKFIIFFFIAIVISNLFNLPIQVYDMSKLLSIVFINIGIFFIALQTKVEKINNLSNLIYPVFLWVTVILISFIVITSLYS